MRQQFSFLLWSVWQRKILGGAAKPEDSERAIPSVDSTGMNLKETNALRDSFPDDRRLQPSPHSAMTEGFKNRLYEIPEQKEQYPSKPEWDFEESDVQQLIPAAGLEHPDRLSLYLIPTLERKRQIRIGGGRVAACILVLAAMGWAWMWREAQTSRSSDKPIAKVKPHEVSKDKPMESNSLEQLSRMENGEESEVSTQAQLGPAPRKKPPTSKSEALQLLPSLVIPSYEGIGNPGPNKGLELLTSMASLRVEAEPVPNSEDDYAQLDWGLNGALTPAEVEMEVLGIRGALRKRLGHWGEGLLNRTEGRWGWRLNGVEEPGRFELSIATLHITHLRHENETYSRH